MPKGANPRRRKARRHQPTAPRSVAEADAPELVELVEGDLDEALSVNDLRDSVSTEVRQAWGADADGRYVWTRDVVIEDDGSLYAIVDVEGDGTPEPGCYRVDVTVDADMTVTLGERTEVQAVTSYEPVATEVTEAWRGDVVPLVETSTRSDGTLPVKVIAPGWGSCGYYSPELLESDGPAAFPAGTHMYWDHPTESDDVERPERSLRDLAAVTVTPAAWLESGPGGPGLYADARPFSTYTDLISEMAPYIGVSIRASGTLGQGTAEGRTGPIVESIDRGRSIDFVTVAGAGGQILDLFESGRSATPTPPVPDPIEETQTMPENPTTQELSEARRELAEARELGAAVAAFLEAHRSEAAEQAAQIERLSEALADRDARAIVAEALDAEDAPELRESARRRVLDAVVRDIPLAEDGTVNRDRLLEAAWLHATAEAAYLAEASGSGRVSGMGSGAPAPDGETDPTADFFARRFGLSESTAQAVASR